MNEMIKAIELLIKLSTVARELGEAGERIGRMIRNAQEEGRDLKQEEIKWVRELREDKMEEWNRLMDEIEE